MLASFDKKYWDENYSRPETMDGIGNAKQHVKYLSSLLSLEMIKINSILDIGAGFGDLFAEMCKTFSPYRAQALEPSSYAFGKLEKKIEKIDCKISLANLSVQDFLKNQLKKTKAKAFDLGICTSVFQYIGDEDLDFVLSNLSKLVRIMYLTVPTNKELDYQINELEFFDRYALRRSRTKYQKIISKYFTVVGSRLLESKNFFDESNSPFSEHLFRF